MYSVNHADLAIDELPTLQSLFDSCDRSVFVGVTMAEHAERTFGLERAHTTKWVAFEHRIAASLDTMCSLAAFPEASEQRLSYVLLPETTYFIKARTKDIGRRVEAALVDLRESKQVLIIRQALGSRSGEYENVEQAQKRFKELVKSDVLDADALETPAYSLRPWEQTLACRVWLPYFLCQRERYMVLSSAFWEMVFFQYDYDYLQALMEDDRTAHPSKEENKNGGIAREMPKDTEMFNSFERAYLKKLSHAVAILNHNARIVFYDMQINLARRLGVL